MHTLQVRCYRGPLCWTNLRHKAHSLAPALGPPLKGCQSIVSRVWLGFRHHLRSHGPMISSFDTPLLAWASQALQMHVQAFHMHVQILQMHVEMFQWHVQIEKDAAPCKVEHTTAFSCIEAGSEFSSAGASFFCVGHMHGRAYNLSALACGEQQHGGTWGRPYLSSPVVKLPDKGRAPNKRLRSCWYQSTKPQ